MIRVTAAAALAAGLSLAACAETPDRADDAAPAAAIGTPGDTSAQSPMTVNPAPPKTTRGQSLPSTPPTLPEDPAQIPEDKSMPPGPVNPEPR